MKAIQRKNAERLRRARRTRVRLRSIPARPARRADSPRFAGEAGAAAKRAGGPTRPRMSVFRSLRHISVQLIDDVAGRTLASATDLEMASAKKGGGPSFRERATWVGGRIAEKAVAQGIREVQFDRGRYRYQGLVAALAAGARKGGLKF